MGSVRRQEEEGEKRHLAWLWVQQEGTGEAGEPVSDCWLEPFQLAGVISANSGRSGRSLVLDLGVMRAGRQCPDKGGPIKEGMGCTSVGWFVNQCAGRGVMCQP